MKTCTLLFFILLGISQLTVAQNKVTGSLQDGTGKAISFANIILLQAKDSVAVKGILTSETGSYAFENVKPGKYLVMGFMMGYEKKYSAPFEMKLATVNIPPLVLKQGTQQLKEVQVTTQRPFVEQEVDRTVINVANSVVASGSTALEVLEKSPGITIDQQNEQIQLRGKTGVLLQIDGKTSYLSAQQVVSMLRSMSSDNIEKIEIITNPSAKYDAAGNSGIINIRLKKKKNQGTNGSLSLAGGSGRYDRQRGSLLLTSGLGKISAFATYSYNKNGNYWDFWNKRTQLEEGQLNNIEQTTLLKMYNTSHNIKTNLDYTLNKETTIGISWTAFWDNNWERGPANAVFQHDNNPAYLVSQTAKTIDESSSNHIGNINLRHNFGDKKGELAADFDVGRYVSSFTNRLVTSLSNGVEQPINATDYLVNQMPTQVNIRVGKADYNLPITKDWKLETGFKVANVTTNNNVTISTGNPLQLDEERSNQFKYSEKINAAYLNLNGKVSAKNDVQLGLRAEHTRAHGDSPGGEYDFDRNYLNFFPSVFLSRKLTKEQTLGLSYSYRIDRPNYQSLNPVYSFIDPYSYYQGNPNLKPQYTQSLELKHGLKEKLFTSIGATFTNQFMFLTTRAVEGKKFMVMMENLDQMQGYNLTLSYPFEVTKDWKLQANLMGYYNQYDYIHLGESLVFRQFSGNMNLSNTISLPKDIKLEVSGWFNTPGRWGFWKVKSMGSLDVGVQKTILTKLKLKVSAQDLLHTNKLLLDFNVPDIQGKVNIIRDTRFFLVGLTYDFGNQEIKARQRQSGSEAELRRMNGGQGL